MTKIGLMALMAIALIDLSVPSTARAETNYPYCAYAGGRNYFENCGYATFQQCLAAVSGVGAHCRPNPRYVQRDYPDSYGDWRRPRR